MVNPWVLPVAFAMFLVVTVFAFRARGRPKHPRWVANSAAVQSDPVVLSALLQYKILRTVGAAGVLLAIISATVLISRPVHREVIIDKEGTRDIVLCLDISGSMMDFDVEIVKKFQDLIPHFSGERIALVIFNSTARTVFPLSDDYDMIAEELKKTESALAIGAGISHTNWRTFLEFQEGTNGVSGQSSLIPDGLASCSLLFDTQPTQRSRTIVLATDNEVAGKPLFTLQQATDVAMERGAIVIGLFAGDKYLVNPLGSPEASEFMQESNRSKGFTLLLTDAASTQKIIDSITSQQFVDISTPPHTIDADRTFPWLVIATIGILVIVIIAGVVRE